MSAHLQANRARLTGRPMQVVVAADAEFLMPLAVTLTSLALAHEPDEVVVTVLHEGLLERDRNRVERGLTGLDVRWLHVPLEQLSGAHHTSCLTRATLFRL